MVDLSLPNGFSLASFFWPHFDGRIAPKTQTLARARHHQLTRPRKGMDPSTTWGMDGYGLQKGIYKKCAKDLVGSQLHMFELVYYSQRS